MIRKSPPIYCIHVQPFSTNQANVSRSPAYMSNSCARQPGYLKVNNTRFVVYDLTSLTATARFNTSGAFQITAVRLLDKTSGMYFKISKPKT